MQFSKVRQRMRGGLAFVFFVVGAALLVPPQAMADSPETEASRADAGSEYTLPPVVITAEKRQTEEQKTPVAVTVFTAQDLEDRNLKTVHDVLAQVPNLMQVDTIGGNTMAAFRGSVTSMGTETNPLVIYVDGVPVDSYSSMDASLLNIERIEVLRGAQSTLYGKNAFSGVVNIISKKPDNTHTGKVYIDGGSEWSMEGGVTTSGPIIEDKLFFSLSGSHDYRDGYMKGPNSNDERNTRVKGQFRLLPTNDSELNLHLAYTKYEEGPLPVVKGSDPSLHDWASDTDHRDKETFSAALHSAVDFSAAELKSVTTFRSDDMRASHDNSTYMVGTYNEYDESSWEATQEFRVQSPADSDAGFSWLAGVYGGYRDLDRKKWFTPSTTINFPYTDKMTEFAPFGQVEVPLFVDALKLTTGLRWQYVKREATIKTIFGGSPWVNEDLDESWEEFLPKAVLSYQITDDYMVYAGVNRSFLPGGFSRQVMPGIAELTYKPQYAWNYEVGAKTSWLENRLNANLTLFYSKYTDMHVTSMNMIIGGPVATNAGKVTAYGAEAELDAQILPGLRGTASVGYTHAEFDEYTATNALGVDVDYSGKRVQYTPEYTGNLSLVYRHSTGFMGQAGVQYASKMYWDAGNSASQGSVTTVNAKIGYEAESFDVYLYATNLFDKRYSTLYESTMNYSLTAPPREVGVQMAYRW